MILGYAKVKDGMLETHRDSYTLSSLTVVSTRRPFFAPAILLSAGFIGFALSFIDLLYFEEITTIIIFSVVAELVASKVGQLRLLSRELSGSELSGAVWGDISSLNKIRSDIARKLEPSKLDDSPEGDAS